MTPKYKKHIFICTNERPLDNPKTGLYKMWRYGY